MRAVQERMAQILEHGATPEQVAQAQAELEASRQQRQMPLALKAKA